MSLLSVDAKTLLSVLAAATVSHHARLLLFLSHVHLLQHN